MPKLSKSFHLEITVEQFLNACSHLELQELDLLLPAVLSRKKSKKDVNLTKVIAETNRVLEERKEAPNV